MLQALTGKAPTCTSGKQHRLHGSSLCPPHLQALRDQAQQHVDQRDAVDALVVLFCKLQVCQPHTRSAMCGNCDMSRKNLAQLPASLENNWHALARFSNTGLPQHTSAASCT